MIYDSLRKLPKIIQVEILETGNFLLLSDEENPDAVALAELWENLKTEFNERYNKQESNKVFNVFKEIQYLENKYNIIHYSVDALEFNTNESLMEVLKNYGYKITIENYNEDLKRIERESEGIIVKIKQFANSLPKHDETKTKTSNIDLILDNMGAIVSILGVDFDFYSVSVEKYHVLEKQMVQKIKSLEKQNSNKKKK